MDMDFMENIKIVLSPMQQRIVELKIKGRKSVEIAQELQCTKQTVSTQLNRIREKIIALGEQNVDIDDVVASETARLNNAHLTVKQAQVLANNKGMVNRDRRSTTSAERHMRCKLNPVANELIVRQMTAEELANCNIEPYRDTRMPPSHIAKIFKEYYEFGYVGNLIEQATAETILRSYGLLYKTPGINKNNRKSTLALGTVGSDKTALMVRPDEKSMLPPGSKYIETIIDEDTNEIDYCLYIVPGSHHQRERKIFTD